MTSPEFFAHGAGELIKGSVHGMLWLLAVICLIYNLTAFAYRFERHLAVNAVVYAALVAWEAIKVFRHLKG